MSKARRYCARIFLICTFCIGTVHAEDGSSAWLRYAPIQKTALYHALPSTIIVQGNDVIQKTAANELQRGLTSMLGRTFTVRASPTGASSNDQSAIVIAAPNDAIDSISSAAPTRGVSADSFHIQSQQLNHNRTRVLLDGASSRAEIYAVFHLLEEIAMEKPIPSNETQTPRGAIRWTDEWDNLDGTIERGYAGPSIFFENGHVRIDLTRAAEYARLLSSIGLNGCNINNVNANLDLLTSDHLAEFARIAGVFRPWGIRLALSVDLTSPQTVGHLTSFDPFDPAVIEWWKEKADEIYKLIPDFAGFTVKADSEGRRGPSQYGRSPVDAANMLARALKSHGGVVLYRGFVYDNHLDWRDLKADRARAGVDNFAKYDGLFDSNVVIQIKEGPIDFQAREPVSPLFGAIGRTNIAIEFQTTQEYTGQQRHMVWLPPMWKWVLDSDLRIDGHATPVKEVVTGGGGMRRNGSSQLAGFVSVTNVGMECNWLHHPMALANLFGFGKLAWNPDYSLEDIIGTWTRLTWGNDPLVNSTIRTMQLNSWATYEGYTGPNGMGTLTNILGYHFGPGVESAERNGWGQWFRADKHGIGMNRTSTGTGFIQQYPSELAARYESLDTCPDDLLLFFHHVPYDYKLHSGKTLIQSIYDTHYASARTAAEYVPRWLALKGKIDDERFQQVLKLFEFQAGHALVWRDAINTWFERISSIPDKQGRVGQDPNRIEVEKIAASSYEVIEVSPSETASGGKVVVCRVASGCTLKTTIQHPTGVYNVAVQYFDVWRGVSHYEMSVNGHPIAQWTGDDTLPPAQFDAHLDGQDSTRFTAHGVHLKPGDILSLSGIPDLRPELKTQDPAPDYREFAPVDYIELGPDGAITPQ
jgi:alpha-glucuronidase